MQLYKEPQKEIFPVDVYLEFEERIYYELASRYNVKIDEILFEEIMNMLFLNPKINLDTPIENIIEIIQTNFLPIMKEQNYVI